MRFLAKTGATCDYYLPNRLTEGYGISAEGVDELSRRGTHVMITVDCGISAIHQIARAAQGGMDVIVTDHHEPNGPLPEAYAILNPKVENCEYPERNLAGVGVALKLCQALAKGLGMDTASWLDELDLAALGTAADIVALIGENRTIVSLGYERILKTNNIGLRALIEKQGVSGAKLSTRQIVFQLAPLINAAGRLGDPSIGAKLLLTNDAGGARRYAAQLQEANRERQALDRKVQQEAVGWVEENCNPENDYGLVAYQPHWHAGVIGIAASRLVETFYRPAFLFGQQKDGLSKGSGRSIAGVHLMEALSDCADCMENFGGHAAAAGATIKVEKIDEFRLRFNEAIRERVTPDMLAPRIDADAEVEISCLSQKFYNILKQMEPFGPGNMRPVLVCRGLKNRYKPRIVGTRHLKMNVSAGGIAMDAIAFNFGNRLEEVRAADSFSLAFALDENEWNGKVSLQMKVKGVEV